MNNDAIEKTTIKKRRNWTIGIVTFGTLGICVSYFLLIGAAMSSNSILGTISVILEYIFLLSIVFTFIFNNQHNQSQIRSRGYGIGNHVVGLPPGAPDAFYTQPGSPYNPYSIRKLEYIGDLDEGKGGGRPYKSDKSSC